MEFRDQTTFFDEGSVISNQATTSKPMNGAFKVILKWALNDV